MNISHNNIFLAKKNSCFLYNINANNKLKQKYLEKKSNNLIEHEHKINNNSYNPLKISLNNKSLSRTKSSLLSRPYQRQLSNSSFSTKKKLNKDEYNTFKLNGNNNVGNNFEKDEKISNIYYTLIKTFYDENGIKLNSQETNINPVNNEFNSKIIKTKKPLNKKSLDLIFIGNTNDFRSKNEVMNNDYNKNFYQYNNNTNPKITNMNKLKITHKKIIKREKNMIENKTKKDIINMTQMPNSTYELSFNEKYKYIFTNPNISEKTLKLLINQNHTEKPQNYIKNEKELQKYLEINKSIKKINKGANNLLFINKKESEKKKNKYIIIPHINRKLNQENNKNSPDDFSYIFHKKNPSDSFDNINLIKKKLENKNKIIDNKEYSCKAYNKINNSSVFSFSKNSLNKTSINKHKVKKPNISPKRLEKQLSDYQRVFDKCYIVIPADRYEQYLDSLAPEVGIITLSKQGKSIVLEEKRPATKQESIDSDVLINCLHTEEYKSLIVRECGYLPKVPGHCMYDACRRLMHDIPAEKQRSFFRDTVKGRKNNTALLKSIPFELRQLCLSLGLDKRGIDGLLLRLNTQIN